MSVQLEPRLHDLVIRTNDQGHAVKAFFILSGARRTTNTPVEWEFDPADEYTIMDAALEIDQTFYRRNLPEKLTFWQKLWS